MKQAKQNLVNKKIGMKLSRKEPIPFFKMGDYFENQLL